MQRLVSKTVNNSINPVSNRSFHILSPNLTISSELVRTLGLGLKYVPFARPPPWKDIESAVHKFQRSLLIQAHFKDRPPRAGRGQYIPQFYIQNSNWTPTPSISLQNAFNSLLYDLKSEIKPLFDQAEQNCEIPAIIHELKRIPTNPSFRIIATDKNLGLAIISHADYKRMVEHHLLDATAYRLEPDSTLATIHNELDPQLRSLTRRAIQLFGGDILKLDEYLNQFLDKCSIPHFHCLAKVHKTPLKGRPIAGAVNWFTTGLSALLSFLLRKSILHLPHIIKDSGSLIKKLEGLHIEQGDYFVSLDIEALYPNMDQDKTVLALFSLPDQSLTEEQRQWIIDTTAFVLNSSYVQFDGQIFKQIKGMPMGTNAAVELANLYVHHHIEHPAMRKKISNRLRAQGYQDQSTHWNRFIDDIFLIWKGDRQAFNGFLECLNSIDPSLKFTHHISQLNIPFLDLDIFAHNEKLGFRTYQKPLNRFLYIPHDSQHPFGAKKGFILGELIRYSRNSTFEADFKVSKRAFKLRLQLRGYPDKLLDSLFSQVSHGDRLMNQSQHRRSRQNNRQGRVPPRNQQQSLYIPLRYHPIIQSSGIQQRLRRYLEDLKLQDDFNVMVSYSSNANISRLATRSKF